jgi:hypothetical protein
MSEEFEDLVRIGRAVSSSALPLRSPPPTSRERSRTHPLPSAAFPTHATTLRPETISGL